MNVVVVAGTGTEIGKTFVGAAVVHALRAQGRTVIARKPAQSFEQTDTVTDASILGGATGEAPEVVCPKHRWYPVPMAPPMAAVALGRDPFSTSDLVLETRQSLTTADVALVETAGGSWSPQASDGLHVGDFAAQLHADAVLLVADAGLGVIHAVRGAAAAFAEPPIVFLNRYDAGNGLHVENRAWLAGRDRFTVVTSAAEAAVMLAAI
ncbi:MAG TPA: ATP-dependent dethiobiotin synthetase BioD [Acidimicrobiales bacterium]|nr:ATP-dependent dethiobiotin synthetase BioD [Acidimicrobiales bacterium]